MGNSASNVRPMCHVSMPLRRFLVADSAAKTGPFSIGIKGCPEVSDKGRLPPGCCTPDTSTGINEHGCWCKALQARKWLPIMLYNQWEIVNHLAIYIQKSFHSYVREG
jgi:hypothetical protein